MCAMPLEHEIEYPTSDGQPMAETTLHRVVMSDVIGGLERRYAEVPDVWVGGNLFLYFQKGDMSACVAPDVLLVQGVDKTPRDSFMLWNEKPPALIFEITSRSTKGEDTGNKKERYRRIGVAELVLFDPFEEYLHPRLQGFRLARRQYHPIKPNRDGSLDLRTTGVTARPEGTRLRLVDMATGEKLLWNDEIDAARRLAEERAVAAEERAVQEAAGRRLAEERAAAAEERVRALAEELARLRRGPEAG